MHGHRVLEDGLQVRTEWTGRPPLVEDIDQELRRSTREASRAEAESNAKAAAAVGADTYDPHTPGAAPPVSHPSITADPKQLGAEGFADSNGQVDTRDALPSEQAPATTEPEEIEPPKRNAKREDWATFAAQVGIEVTDEMGRDEIIVAYENSLADEPDVEASNDADPHGD